MQKIEVKMNLKVSVPNWEKFILTRVYLTFMFDGTEVTLSFGRLKLRRISPVPRTQYLEIFFRRQDDEFCVESAQMVAPDDSEIPYTPEEIEADVRYMIEEAISSDIDSIIQEALSAKPKDFG